MGCMGDDWMESSHTSKHILLSVKKYNVILLRELACGSFPRMN